MGKDEEKCEMIKSGYCKSFQTILVGKDGKMCKTIKIGHSKSFLDHFGGKRLEKKHNDPNWCSESFYTTLVGKDRKSVI